MKLGLLFFAFFGFVIAAIAISRLLEYRQTSRRRAARRSPPPQPEPLANGVREEELATNELPDARLPYVPRESLLTAGEMAFLPVLEEAVAHVFGSGNGLFDGWRVETQVPVSLIMGVDRSLDASTRQSYRSKINRKTIDFVVCDERLRPRIAIELDPNARDEADPDATHTEMTHREDDVFMDEAFAAARVRLVRVPVRERHDVEAIAALLRASS